MIIIGLEFDRVNRLKGLMRLMSVQWPEPAFGKAA
jgi:hypothetical protein